MTTEEAIENMTEPLLAPEPHQDTIDGLRALAEFIEAHRHSLPPYIGGTSTVNVPCTPEKLAAIARAGYGRLEKLVRGEYLILRKHLAHGVQIDFYTPQDQCCERVKVGERLVEAKPERALPAEPAKLEEIFEWRCPPLLGKQD